MPKRKRKTNADKAREATESKLKDTVVNFLQKQREALSDNRDRIMMGAAVEIVSRSDPHELSQWIHTAIQASFLDRFTEGDILPKKDTKQPFPPGGGLVMTNMAEGETIPGSPITGDPISGEA
jgi:hypothetical protein